MWIHTGEVFHSSYGGPRLIGVAALSASPRPLPSMPSRGRWLVDGRVPQLCQGARSTMRATMGMCARLDLGHSTAAKAAATDTNHSLISGNYTDTNSWIMTIAI